MQRSFKQVDVFTAVTYRGNPVAVVIDGSDVDTEDMQRFAHWTNLSETTFLLPPEDQGADYRVRIFTPVSELPFAGHPTIGSCHAWLESGGEPRKPGQIVQECGVGLVELKQVDGRIAFAAPPLIRSGPVEAEILEQALESLGLGHDEVVSSAWVDNGPGWLAVRVATVERLGTITPTYAPLDIGVVAPHRPGGDAQWEVRAFFPVGGAMREDPVTGSLNASLAQWMLADGVATAPYVAAQGAALGRAGRVNVSQDPDGTIWVGGNAVTCINGSVEI
jgi:PhzF family phenazine biosynthesis protein